MTSLRFSYALVAFGLAKGAAFLSPILVAGVLTPLDYGAFEQAWATGQVLAVAFGLGLAAAAPFFLLEENRVAMRRFFRLHVVIVASIGVTMAAAALLSGRVQGSLTVALAVAIACQLITAAVAKVDNRPARAALVESGWQLLLLVVALATMVFELGGGLELSDLGLILLAALTVASAYGWRLQIRIKLRLAARHYCRALPVSTKALAAGLLMVPLVAFSRLTIGRLLTPEDLGNYAAAFRLISIGIVVHQFAVVFLFRTLYTSRSHVLDRLTLAVLIATAATAGTVAMMINVLPSTVVPAFLQNVMPSSQVTVWVLAGHMICWSSLALTEMQMIRSDRAPLLAILCAGGLVVAGLVVWTIAQFRSLGVVDIAAANVIGMGVPVLVGEVFLYHTIGSRRWSVLITGVVMAASLSSVFL